MFVKLASVQQKNEIYEEDVALLQQYFVVMYIATCNATDGNTCRRILFANGASVENTPPTSATLKQHICEPFFKQRNGVDVSRNKESNQIHLTGTGKKLKTNIYHFGVN